MLAGSRVQTWPMQSYVPPATFSGCVPGFCYRSQQGLEKPALADLITISHPGERLISMRREHDLLGDRDVPASAYYGVHTLRAMENFPITGTPISIYPDLIAALASIKLAAARSNCELGLLDATRANATGAAAAAIRAGRVSQGVVA